MTIDGSKLTKVLALLTKTQPQPTTTSITSTTTIIPTPPTKITGQIPLQMTSSKVACAIVTLGALQIVTFQTIRANEWQNHTVSLTCNLEE